MTTTRAVKSHAGITPAVSPRRSRWGFWHPTMRASVPFRSSNARYGSSSRRAPSDDSALEEAAVPRNMSCSWIARAPGWRGSLTLPFHYTATGLGGHRWPPQGVVCDPHRGSWVTLVGGHLVTPLTGRNSNQQNLNSSAATFRQPRPSAQNDTISEDQGERNVYKDHHRQPRYGP